MPNLIHLFYANIHEILNILISRIIFIQTNILKILNHFNNPDIHGVSSWVSLITIHKILNILLSRSLMLHRLQANILEILNILVSNVCILLQTQTNILDILNIHIFRDLRLNLFQLTKRNIIEIRNIRVYKVCILSKTQLLS